MHFHWRKLLFWCLPLAVIGSLGWLLVAQVPPPQFLDPIFGVSFDRDYAEFLRLDPERLFITLLDEWGFRYLRLGAHWDKTEPELGKFSFDRLDWYLNQAQLRRAKVILTIGQKTPRWPECHLPAWALALPAADYQAALANYLKKVVERYKNNPALEAWQVENEPFLPFGNCPKFSPARLAAEIALVRSLDAVHPVAVSDSGELSSWRRTARAGDWFGTTLYRVVWNPIIGYWSYDRLLPAGFYRLKLWLNRRTSERAYVIELQAEPWMPDKNILELPLSEQAKSMDLERLKKNVAFTAAIGLPRAYLWGAEWWEWMRGKGHLEFGNYVKELKKY